MVEIFALQNSVTQIGGVVVPIFAGQTYKVKTTDAKFLVEHGLAERVKEEKPKRGGKRVKNKATKSKPKNRRGTKSRGESRRRKNVSEN